MPITDFLEALGHRPVSARANDRWYVSPLRKERTPSFKVDSALNVWYDHGEGVGGTIIDLAMRVCGCPDVSSALRAIEAVAGNSRPLPERAATPVPSVAKRPATVVERVGAVETPALARYLTEVRGIPLEVAAPYVGEATYRTADGKRYSSLAFGNRSGGYELRTPGFKGTAGAKDFTLLGDPRGTPVRVFEGFTDFLSALVLWPEERGRPALVLNSVALAARGAEELRLRGCAAECLLDSDEAGSRAFAVFREVLGESGASDARAMLRGSKDVNELLLSEREARE